MCHEPIKLYKHDVSMMKLNQLMIDIKLHLLGVREMSKEKQEQLDEIANSIRRDLERCTEPGLKH